MSGNQQNGLYLSKWTWILHVKIKLLIISSLWNSVALATALSQALERPIGGLLGGVTAGRPAPLGSVFVCLGAALPAAGFEKNSAAQFLSTSDPSSSSQLPSYSSPTLSHFLLLFADLFPEGFLTGPWMEDRGFHKNTVWWMLSMLSTQSSPSSFQLRLFLLSLLNAWRVEGAWTAHPRLLLTGLDCWLKLHHLPRTNNALHQHFSCEFGINTLDNIRAAPLILYIKIGLLVLNRTIMSRWLQLCDSVWMSPCEVSRVISASSFQFPLFVIFSGTEPCEVGFMQDECFGPWPQQCYWTQLSKIHKSTYIHFVSRCCRGDLRFLLYTLTFGLIVVILLQMWKLTHATISWWRERGWSSEETRALNCLF